MRSYYVLIGVLSLAVACDNEEPAEREPSAAVDKSADADNTANNKGDERDSAVTPTDQQENSRDLELTQKIRQDIMDAESLSFAAKNAKVIAQNGKVTLRGAVDTEQERAVIASIAKQTAGAEAVDNQLEVKKNN